MRSRDVLVAAVGLVVALAPWHARAETRYSGWHWVEPVPHPVEINRVFFDGDRFLACESGPSPQGPLDYPLGSRDGHSWVVHLTADPVCPRAVVATDRGLLGAFAERIAISDDGLTWTTVFHPPDFSSMTSFADVALSGSHFVAVGHWDDFSPTLNQREVIYTSDDGVLWEERDLPPIDYPWPWSTALNSVVWTGERFVAVGGDPLLSPDGITWERLEEPGGGAMAFSGDEVLLLSGDGILRSEDGITWDLTLPASEPGLTNLEWTGELFVAVGHSGTVLTSRDGIAWSERSVPVDTELRAAAVGNGTAVVAGDDIFSSSDWVEWDRWLVRQFDLEYPHDIAWNGERIVIVASDGAILLSDDGFEWRRVQSPVDEDLKVVTWAGDRYVAVT